MSRERRKNPWATAVTGLIILAAGLIFWLDQMDKIRARDYFDWWPLALIAVGLAHLPERRWIAAAFYIGIGIAFLLPLVGIPSFRFWQIIGLWPLLISIAGLTLVRSALFPSGSATPGDMFRSIAVMGGQKLTVVRPAAGEIVAVMGGCEIDFSGLPEGSRETVVDVLAFWGGIDLKVPRGWKVERRVAVILGGCEDKTEPAADDAPRLILRGSVIMGGIEVRNSLENAA
jgi:hypothetical protein